MTNIDRALASIATENDTEKLMTFARNARGKSRQIEQAAIRRLAAVSARHAPGTVEHACWAMVETIEATRRLNKAKAWRMNRMRRKIEKDGELAALEYCALKETVGFAEVLEYGMPEFTAEAIVLRYPAAFSEAARAAARRRLDAAGVQLGAPE
ncbi:hypothetical protein [Phenylobacterium sp.]|uniref:hypothetical protein n=1 Tax=Phenylobacterium sp. TaxID=1871053 RepID=UPI002F927929